MTARRQTIRTLLSDTSLYGVARVIASMAGVFLVPVYTRFLTVADYGVIENLNLLTVVFTHLFGLALASAVDRFYTVAADDTERRQIVSSATVATLGLALLGLAIGFCCAPWLGGVLVNRSAGLNVGLVLLALLVGACWLGQAIFLSVLLQQFRQRAYLVVTLGSVLLGIALAVLCVVWLQLGVLGVFVASAVAQTAFTLAAFHTVRRDLALASFSMARSRELAAYSVGLVPVAFATIMMRSSDRWLITAMLPDALPLVGLYGMAEKVMLPLSVASSAFAIAWSPFVMHASRQPDAPHLYGRVFGYYVGVTSALVLALSALSPLVLRILATPPFYPAAAYTPLLGLYLALSGLYHVSTVGIVLGKRVHTLVPIAIVAAVVNLALNLILIPRFAVFGAATATVISFALYNALILAAAERVYPLHYPAGRAAVLYAVATAAGFGVLHDRSAGAALCLLYAFVLWRSRFLEGGTAWFHEFRRRRAGNP